MNGVRGGRARACAVAAATVAAVAAAPAAWAHAHVSPGIVASGESEVFTLAVPTEEAGATTTQVELTVPNGFSIDSFLPSPGWKRTVRQTGSGSSAVVQQVTWSGGSVPTGEATDLRFLASANSTKTYVFSVRQTYSSGKVVDWSGPKSSDTPAPRVAVESSLGGGGGGGSSTLALVALIVAAAAVVLALGAIAARAGGRALA